MPKGMLPKETLRKLQDAPDSAIFKVPKALHLAIHPQYLGNIQLGIVNYFNHEMNRFNKELDGILMGHGKIRLKEPKAEVLNEEHYLHLDVHSDFWIFRPQVDSILSGVVNKKSPAHISVLVHGLFNVPCHKNMDSDTVWMGSDVSVGSHVKVRILQMDLNQKVPFLLGELYESKEIKEEKIDLVLVENIKEEKVWEDITEKEKGSDSQGEEEEPLMDDSAHTKKKKKKKKSKRESDQEEPQLASSFVLSPRQNLEFNPTRRGDSPILTQAENVESMDDVINNEYEPKEDDSVDEMTREEVPKKKKKKKKNRSLSPQRSDIEEDSKEALSVSLLATLNNVTKKKKSKKHKEEDYPSITDKSVDEDKVKEDLSNSLILEMLSKEKKSKKKKRKSGCTEDESSVNQSMDETIDESNKSKDPSAQLNDSSATLTPCVPQKEKKSKKRKSLADEQLSILRQTVEDNFAEETKRKRSASESSTSDNFSKKAKLDLSVSQLNDSSMNGNSSDKSFLNSPRPFQEPRLPPGWTYITHGAQNRKKTWLSPSGKKFTTLKSANEFISKSKN